MHYLMKCPFCGKEVVDAAKICPHCGAEKEWRDEKIQNKEEEKHKKNIDSLMIIIGGSIVFFIIWLIAKIFTYFSYGYWN